MEDREAALIKSLVHVMWADGEIADSERELMGRILVGLGCTSQEVAEIGTMMKAPPSIDGIVKDIPDLESKETLIKTIACMAMADGVIAEKEMHFLNRLGKLLQLEEKDVKKCIDEVLVLIKNELENK